MPNQRDHQSETGEKSSSLPGRRRINHNLLASRSATYNASRYSTQQERKRSELAASLLPRNEWLHGSFVGVRFGNRRSATERRIKTMKFAIGVASELKTLRR